MLFFCNFHVIQKSIPLTNLSGNWASVLKIKINSPICEQSRGGLHSNSQGHLALEFAMCKEEIRTKHISTFIQLKKNRE